MESSEELSELYNSLSCFQGEVPNIPKSKKVNIKTKSGYTYSYCYADLATIWETIRPILSKHGLSIFQDAVSADDEVRITTRINHKSGQWIQSASIAIPLSVKDIHTTGSCITYGRRYSMCIALGIVSDDDTDGKEVIEQQTKSKPKEKPKATVEQIKGFFKHYTDSDEKLTEYLSEFIEKYSTHYKMGEAQTVYELMNNEEKFKKQFEEFCKKKETTNEETTNS
jgi:hypothetical protein